MKTKTYKFADRKNWKSGKWDNEPDKKQWEDKKTGLPCLAVRNGTSGFWCGYVGVFPDHPLYKLDYGEDALEEIRVHGGLTYSDSCQIGESEKSGICHVPGKDEPDNVWWFGFDCMHSEDALPVKTNKMSAAHWLWFDIGRRRRTYRTLRYVAKECAALALQLKDLSL